MSIAPVPKPGAGNHKHQRGGCECRERRNCRWASRAGEQLTAADAVTVNAHGHGQAAEAPGSRINDLAAPRRGGAQRLSDCGHREASTVVDGTRSTGA